MSFWLWEDLRFLWKFCTSSDFRVLVSKRVATLFFFVKQNFWQILKEYWVWYLLVVAAFFAGWSVGGAYYSVVCSGLLADQLKSFGVGLL